MARWRLVRIGAARGAAVVAVSLAAAVAAAEEGSDPIPVEMGGVLFARHCAACHGLDGKGGGPAAGVLHTRPADLTRIAARRGGRFPGEEIGRFIDGREAVAAHGSREMPVWGERFGEGIGDAGVAGTVVRGRLLMLVAYLESLQERSYLDDPAGD